MRSSEARASELWLNGSRSKAWPTLCQVLWLSFVHLLFLFVLTHALPPQEIVCERPFTLNQTLISLPKSETVCYTRLLPWEETFCPKPCLEQKLSYTRYLYFVTKQEQWQRYYFLNVILHSISGCLSSAWNCLMGHTACELKYYE